MKVFQLNDCDWYMATTLEEAIDEAIRVTELPREEVVDNPRELTDEDMERLKFVDEGVGKRTFAEERERRLATDPRPQFFASTEY